MNLLANRVRFFRAAALPLPHAWAENIAKDGFRGSCGQRLPGTRKDLEMASPMQNCQSSFPELGSTSHESIPVPLASRPNRATPNLRSISSTAVPLRFRRPPQSPLLTRDFAAMWSTDSIPSPSKARSRPKHCRASSTGYRSSSTDFRPLYLVERNRGTRQSIHAYQPFLSRHYSYSAVSLEREREPYPCAPETPLESFYTPLESPGNTNNSEYYRTSHRRTTSQQTIPKAPRLPLADFDCSGLGNIHLTPTSDAKSAHENVIPRKLSYVNDDSAFCWQSAKSPGQDTSAFQDVALTANREFDEGRGLFRSGLSGSCHTTGVNPNSSMHPSESSCNKWLDASNSSVPMPAKFSLGNFQQDNVNGHVPKVLKHTTPELGDANMHDPMPDCFVLFDRANDGRSVGRNDGVSPVQSSKSPAERFLLIEETGSQAQTCEPIQARSSLPLALQDQLLSALALPSPVVDSDSVIRGTLSGPSLAALDSGFVKGVPSSYDASKPGTPDTQEAKEHEAIAGGRDVRTCKQYGDGHLAEIDCEVPKQIPAVSLCGTSSSHSTKPNAVLVPDLSTTGDYPDIADPPTLSNLEPESHNSEWFLGLYTKIKKEQSRETKKNSPGAAFEAPPRLTTNASNPSRQTNKKNDKEKLKVKEKQNARALGSLTTAVLSLKVPETTPATSSTRTTIISPYLTTAKIQAVIQTQEIITMPTDIHSHDRSDSESDREVTPREPSHDVVADDQNSEWVGRNDKVDSLAAAIPGAWHAEGKCEAQSSSAETTATQLIPRTGPRDNLGYESANTPDSLDDDARVDDIRRHHEVPKERKGYEGGAMTSTRSPPSASPLTTHRGSARDPHVSDIVGGGSTPIDYFNYRDTLGKKLEVRPADPIFLDRESFPLQNKVQPVGQLSQHDDVEEAKNVLSSKGEERGRNRSGNRQKSAADTSVCGPGIPTTHNKAEQIDRTSAGAHHNRGALRLTFDATKTNEDDGPSLPVISNGGTLDLTHSDFRSDPAIDDIISAGLSVSGFASLHKLDDHRSLARSILSPVYPSGGDEVAIRTPSLTGVLSLWQSYSMKSRPHSPKGSSHIQLALFSPFENRNVDTLQNGTLASIRFPDVPFDLRHSKPVSSTDLAADSTQSVDKCYARPWCSTSSSNMLASTEEIPDESHNDQNPKTATGVSARSNDAQDTNAHSAGTKYQSLHQGSVSGEDLPDLMERGSHSSLEQSDTRNPRSIHNAPLEKNELGQDRSEHRLGMPASATDQSQSGGPSRSSSSLPSSHISVDNVELQEDGEHFSCEHHVLQAAHVTMQQDDSHANFRRDGSNRDLDQLLQLRDSELHRKDEKIASMKAVLENLHEEIARLSEYNQSLTRRSNKHYNEAEQRVAK